MNQFDDFLRSTLSELAEEAVPVNLTQRAVVAARRKRVTTLTIAGVAVATILIGTPIAVAAAGGGPTPAAPSPSPSAPAPSPSGPAPSPSSPVPSPSASGPANVPSPSSPAGAPKPSRSQPSNFPSPSPTSVRPSPSS
ncbi:hypothetical protein AB0H43_04645 [Hamadaea sp. NPDC050747]|uniref:hypothetical protein n=1 Tax=Hamadaea sp. NPDC050747 TaxID=3155789 RepID=UPI0033C718AB